MDLPNSRPVKPDTAPDHTDDSEQCLLKALDAIADEACRVKDHWVKDTDLTRDLDLYRGKLKGNADDRYFDCNFVGAFIDRMVAQLTDNRPIIRLENRKAGISKVARSVEKVIQCVWDESKVQRGLFKLANNAAVNRSAGLYTGFDTDLNTPNVELLRIGQVLIDPNVVESGQVDSADADPGNKLPERNTPEGAAWEPLQVALDRWDTVTIRRYIRPQGWALPSTTPKEGQDAGATSGAPAADGAPAPTPGVPATQTTVPLWKQPAVLAAGATALVATSVTVYALTRDSKSQRLEAELERQAREAMKR